MSKLLINKYYDPMSGNFLIPKNEITTEMFAEILKIIGEKDLSISVDKNNNINDIDGYMLFSWSNDEQSFWCLTNWLV